MRLSIVIPVFNEAGRLDACLSALDRFVRERPYGVEVLFVDDYSRDATASLLGERLEGRAGFRLLRSAEGKGKGGAVRTGMREARGEFILFCDVDLSTPLDEVDRFLGWAGDSALDGSRYDIVIGSRRMEDSRILRRQPFLRALFGRAYAGLVRLAALPSLRDTQCGFKLFTARAASEVFRRQTVSGFGFDVELLSIAVRSLGFKVKEAPVVWTDSPESRVRLLSDPCRMLLDLLRVVWNVRTGAYDP
ncbi:MAG: glycosyltransferase family 2 protein [Elusimicrobia bacterium]|nr:glycosyltransferase family 2 protein [Elusimicrobiota bacterium]